MTQEELQQAIKSKETTVVPPEAPTDSANPEKLSQPSLDEFLNTLMHLRTIRLSRLSIVKLGSAQTSINASFKPTRLLIVRLFITGKSATTPVVMQFNGDTGTNYLYNVTANNASVSSITIDNASSTDDVWATIEIENVRENGKMIVYKAMRYTGVASGSATKVDGVGAWDNKTTQITSIQITPSAGGGATFGAGSFIEVFGVD